MANNFTYSRIYGELRQRIDSGELAPGSRMETEMELRQRYGVSRETVRRALSMLESEGYIKRKVSAGTFVREKKAQYASARYHESFTEQMQRLGKIPSSQIRSIEILTDPPNQVASAMALRTGKKSTVSSGSAWGTASPWPPRLPISASAAARTCTLCFWRTPPSISSTRAATT